MAIVYQNRLYKGEHIQTEFETGGKNGNKRNRKKS